MKATELRIGNLVNYNNQQCEISASDFAVFEMYEKKKLELTSYTPIPLTEEWLLKFGFESKYKSVNMQWSFGGLELEQISDEDDDGNSIPQEEIFYYDWKFKVKYVHQLQNLYFALTEKELKIDS